MEYKSLTLSINIFNSLIFACSCPLTHLKHICFRILLVLDNDGLIA